MPGPSLETLQKLPPPPPPTPPLSPVTHPTGLVSWERIALQNARLRLEIQPTPSPISPLTMPAALGGLGGILRRAGSSTSLRSKLSSSTLRSPTGAGPTSGAMATGQPLRPDSPVSSMHSPSGRPSTSGSSHSRTASHPTTSHGSNSGRRPRPASPLPEETPQGPVSPISTSARSTSERSARSRPLAGGSPVLEEIHEEPARPPRTARSNSGKSARSKRAGSPLGSGLVKLPLRKPGSPVLSLQSATALPTVGGSTGRPGTSGSTGRERSRTMESAISNLGRTHSERERERERRRKEVRWSRDVNREG